MLQQSTRSSGLFWVDWWLHNHCEWSCSYCPELLRSGSLPWPNLRDCEHFIDQLTLRGQELGLTPRIKFTGGEPTAWASLEDLLDYAHARSVVLALRTNADLDQARWARVIKPLTELELNFHPEHSQVSRFLLNCDRALAQGITVRAVFNMLPHRFEETEQTLARLRDRYPQISIERRMLFADPVINTQPMPYTEPQRVKLVRQWGDIRRIQDGETSYTDYPSLVSESANAYQGWTCHAGLEQIIVDAWGRVARGHCRQGGSLGSLGNTIRWPSEPVVCRKDRCANAFDILATKTV